LMNDVTNCSASYTATSSNADLMVPEVTILGEPKDNNGSLLVQFSFTQVLGTDAGCDNMLESATDLTNYTLLLGDNSTVSMVRTATVVNAGECVAPKAEGCTENNAECAMYCDVRLFEGRQMTLCVEAPLKTCSEPAAGYVLDWDQLPAVSVTYIRPVCDQPTVIALTATNTRTNTTNYLWNLTDAFKVCQFVESDVAAVSFAEQCPPHAPAYEYVHPSQAFVWEESAPTNQTSCPGHTYPYGLGGGRVTCCCGDGCCWNRCTWGQDGTEQYNAYVDFPHGTAETEGRYATLVYPFTARPDFSTERSTGASSCLVDTPGSEWQYVPSVGFYRAMTMVARN